jgi:uncharacterized protein (DUF1330 family)
MLFAKPSFSTATPVIATNTVAMLAQSCGNSSARQISSIRERWRRTFRAPHIREVAMKTIYATVLGLVIGVAIGGFGFHRLQAQTKPPAYVIAENEVTDQDGYTKDFAPLAKKSIEAAGGQFLARGKAVSLSAKAPNRVVIVRFENMDQLQKWWQSPERQQAWKIGAKYVKFADIAIEGVGQ